MDNLTQDVLAYTRTTRCKIEIAPIDLDVVCADVIEQYPARGSFAERITIHRPLGCVMGHVPSLIRRDEGAHDKAAGVVILGPLVDQGAGFLPREHVDPAAQLIAANANTWS